APALRGPFLALGLQHDPPNRLRATLAASFVFGTGAGLVGLAIAGQVSAEQLRVSLVWLPFVVLGYLAAGPVRARLSGFVLRRIVLGVFVVASVGVLAHAPR